jgi:hypothetical protein
MKIDNFIKSYLRNFYYDVKELIVHDRDLLDNVKLKDKYRGKRIFILGSGGSIKLYDLKQLENENVMTQNNFHVHPDINKINPAFHCVVPYYQTEKEQDAWVDWIGDMEEKMPETRFFWGKNTKEIISDKFPKINDRSYYIKAKYNVLTLNKARIDMTKTLMSIPTATTQCISIALYMGFSEIYLLGFDNDQIFHERKTQNRFYGMSKITDTDAERDILNKQRGKEITTSWFNKWLTSKQLDLLEKYALENDISVINASNEGILDNFIRKPLIDIIGNDMLNKESSK